MLCKSGGLCNHCPLYRPANRMVRLLRSKIQQRRSEKRALKANTRGLRTTIAGLLSDGGPPNGVVARQGQRTILSRLGPNGSAAEGVETELLIPFGAESDLQATLFRVQPGAGGDGMMRQHEGDEVGYVVTGKIMLTVAGDTYPVQAGDAFFFPSMRPHGVRNPGNSVTTIISVNTSPTL